MLPPIFDNYGHKDPMAEKPKPSQEKRNERLKNRSKAIGPHPLRSRKLISMAQARAQGEGMSIKEQGIRHIDPLQYMLNVEESATMRFPSSRSKNGP